MLPAALFLPVSAGAAVGANVAAPVTSSWPLLAILVAGGAGWWLARRRYRRTGRTGGQQSGEARVALILERMDCLLWEADVEVRGEKWIWSFRLQSSGLARRIFGAKPPPNDNRFWDQLELPDRDEMDRRCREALRSGQSGYEHRYRVIEAGRLRLLQENVAITRSGPDSFSLVALVTDVTAQHEAELATRAREDQLQQLMTHANCMLWQAHVTRNAGGEFHWEWFVPRSELYRRIAGEDPTRLVSMPWGQVNVPEFDEIEARSRDAMLRGLPGYEQVFRVVLSDGTLWMHEQAAITRLGPDRWKLEGVVMDITAQRRAEEAQRSSERRLEHLLERADCTIWQGQVQLGADGELQWNLYVAPSQLFRRICDGRTDMAGFMWRELGVPEIEQMRRTARQALLGAAPGYEQTFHLPKPGGDLWLTEQVSISPAGPDCWDMVGVITDVTARQEAEEARRASEAQLQQMLELADCLVWHGTWSRDAAGVISWDIVTHRSVLYRRLFGDDDRKPTISWHTLDVPETAEMDRRLDDAIRLGLPGYEQEFRVIAPLRVTWLHEIVTITPLAPQRMRLVGVITDITAQREAQEAHRASVDQVGQMLATADCLLWQARVFALSPEDLRWVLLIPPSRLYREVFGADPPDPPVLLWLQVIDAATNDENNRRSTAAIRSGAPGYEQEFRAQRGDRVFWLHEQVSISRVGPGEWRLVGVLTDVTARRAAEQAVRASEVRYRSLFQHTPVAIVETDFSAVGQWLDELRGAGVRDLATWLDGDERRVDEGIKRVRISAANETALQMLRARRSGDFRRRRRLLATLDTRRVTRDALVALWHGQNTLAAEVEMRDFEGGLHHMHVRWWTAQAENRLDLRQSVLVFVDLTKLKQAEAALAAEKERLAVTLRAMAEGVITTDVAGRVQFINPAAAALIQWNAAALGLPVGEICVLENDRTGSPCEVPVRQVAQGGGVVDLPPDTRLVARAGQRRLVAGCCAPIHSAAGVVIGMVLVFRDVTEQERLEQEVVRATRLESVGILAGGIAHDFNNILTGVMGNLALAQLDIDATSEVAARLRDAEKATLRARDLTQQLLTFAKGGEPVRAAVELEGTIRETTAFALHGSSVKESYDLPGDLWPADADKGQIARVVQNLVINAVQAMPAGGTLCVSAQNERLAEREQPGLPPGEYVRITIADTGDGIAVEDLPRIFDPYFTTKQNGTGLGLAAVYSIVNKHRGHIAVSSVRGRGTTFQIWLPALRHARAAVAPRVFGDPSRFTGRVLFMDDEETIRVMAKAILQRMGFEVECALHGGEAVAKYRAAYLDGRPFALVIMDLTIPGGMGGREAIRQLREIDPGVRAIVSSGYSSDPVLAGYREHGFCGVVVKPYKLEDFIAAIRRALAATGD